MLNYQLGGEGWRTWNKPQKKPKWMRWATYERKYDAWKRAVDKADAEFVMRVARRLK